MAGRVKVSTQHPSRLIDTPAAPDLDTSGRRRHAAGPADVPATEPTGEAPQKGKNTAFFALLWFAVPLALLIGAQLFRK